MLDTPTPDNDDIPPDRVWQLRAARGDITNPSALAFVRGIRTYRHDLDPEMAQALDDGDSYCPDITERWPEPAPPIDVDPGTMHALDALTNTPDHGHTYPAGDWLLDAPPGIPAIWGEGDRVLWPEGEPLLIVAPPGVGKTTIAGQLAFARIGIDTELLGYPVTPTTSKVLYLAMDRPRQIQRALARLATPQHRDVLNDRLVIRPGPPPKDIAKHPELLAYLANAVGADTLIVDSLKDAALGLSDDETGAGVNRAFQMCMAEGIELAGLHHQRKGQNGTKPKTLEDVYGSTWITAGVGSVLLLWGKPGDAIVELTHLKQPGAVIGPLKLEHDPTTGRTVVSEGFDFWQYLRGQRQPFTAQDMARQMEGGKAPDPSAVKRAKRRLDEEIRAGKVHKIPGQKGGAGGTQPDRYSPVDNRHGATDRATDTPSRQNGNAAADEQQTRNTNPQVRATDRATDTTDTNGQRTPPLSLNREVGSPPSDDRTPDGLDPRIDTEPF